MSISFDAPGCFQLDDESGARGADFCYAELIERGYTGLSLGSVEEKDRGSLKYIRNLVVTENEIKCKDAPTCLKIEKSPSLSNFAYLPTWSEMSPIRKIMAHPTRVLSFEKYAIPSLKTERPPQTSTSQSGGFGEESVTRLNVNLRNPP